MREQKSRLEAATICVIQWRMPILTIRLTAEELSAADRAAARHNLSRSEFARRALTAAVSPQSKTASIRGALKGKFTYKQAMKLLRG